MDAGEEVEEVVVAEEEDIADILQEADSVAETRDPAEDSEEEDEEEADPAEDVEEEEEKSKERDRRWRLRANPPPKKISPLSSYRLELILTHSCMIQINAQLQQRFIYNFLVDTFELR